MGLDDRVEANVDKAKGKIKEEVGDALDDRSTELDGKKDQLKGEVKEGWENVKDDVRHEVREHSDK